MSELLPVLSWIKLEIEAMNKTLSKMTKTNIQKISEYWVTPEQVKATLKISNRTLSTLKKSGQLPCSKIKGLTYFRTIDIENMLKQNYVNPLSTETLTTTKNKDDE